jgi:hypothetical protein
LARKVVKILSRILLALLLLLITVWILVQLTPVQNWLSRKAAKWLSTELKTEVTVKHVEFSLFNKVLLEGVLVKDRQQDTLVYIGRGGVNVSDWFFLRDKIELSYISLEQTKVYLHRTDSVWNYQFLVDYFSSPNAKKDTAIQQTDLRLSDINIQQLSFIQKDEWVGQTIQGSLHYLTLNFKTFQPQNKLIEVESIALRSPYFSIANYDGKQEKKAPKPDSYYHDDQWLAEHISKPSGWKFTADKVTVENAAFRSDANTKRAPFEYFDAAHLHFKDINGSFTNLQFLNDTLTAKLQLTAKERSGFEIKEMNADFSFQSTAMEFKNLLLRTNKSRLENYFAFRFEQFGHDMTQFISHVRMDGVFEDSELHTDDIAFFAPALKDWNDRIAIKGKIRGTVDHLKGTDMVISTLKQTVLDGNFTLDGLPDINTTFLDLKANRLQSSYADAVMIYPALRDIKVPAISQISYLKFTGSYTGFFKDFVTYGSIETNLGTVVTDINLKLPEGSAPIYSGKIKTNGFALGRFLDDPLLGTIVMDGSLKGRGFNPKTLFAEVDGNIQAIYLNGYTYRNITAKGIYEKRKFDGSFVANDSNLIVNLTGLVNFNSDTPVYKLAGDIYKINFQQLGLINRNISLKTVVDVDFKGKTIDDFLGTANLQNAVLTKDNDTLSFDYLTLSSVYAEGKKLLKVSSNEAEVTIKGDFNILDLPNTTLSFLHNYFPSYIAAPKKIVKKQDFTFDIVTRNIAEYIDLLELPIKGFDNSSINGRINTNENSFNLKTNVPFFQYNKIGFNDAMITAVGDYTRLNVEGTMLEVKLSDSLSLPQTNFKVIAANDTGSVSIRTRASQTLKDANLNARISAKKEGIGIIFQPSTLAINDKVWSIEDKSDLFIGNNMITSERIELNSGNERIIAYTQLSPIGNYEDFVVELDNVHMEDIVPYFLKDPRLEGQVTGRVDVINPFGKVQVEADLKAARFRFNNDSIGLVTIKGNYNVETGDINTELASDNPLYEFSTKGKINLKDPANPTIEQTVDAQYLKLSILEKYLSVIMTDMKGVATGLIQITGNATKPDLIGDVKLSNTSFVLDYTKCRYAMGEGTVIAFKKGEIDFGQIILTDTAKRTATFSGKLYHEFFKDMRFNMAFRANNAKQGFQVLNTKKKDNPLFYGNLVADASGSITGPVNDMVLKLRAEPTDSSHVYLPTSDTRVTGVADFIVFRRYGKEMKVESDVKATSHMLVELNVIANPLAKIDLILDEVTNDVVQGQGSGDLKITVSTRTGTSMEGRYNITNGKYTFNWQALIKKRFEINSGYVQWNGNPYDAEINIDATYTVDNITLPAELTGGTCSNERSQVIVVGNLSGTLSKPKIDFSFELPPNHPCKGSPITIAGFARMKANPNELNNQVFSMLFFNQFLSGTSSSSSAAANIGSSVFTSAAGTISEFIAQQVEVGIGVALRNIPGINKLNLDPYVTFTPGLISGAQAQNNGFTGTGSFGITRRLLNGRLLLKAGGSVLVNTGQNTQVQNNNQLTPDFTLEWLITPDGKLRLIGFYRSVYDVQWRSGNRAGISFSYVKDFEK